MRRSGVQNKKSLKKKTIELAAVFFIHIKGFSQLGEVNFTLSMEQVTVN